MNCREFEARIDRLLDPRATGPELDAMHAHRASCADCSALFAVLSEEPTHAPELVPFLHAHLLAERTLPQLAQLDPGPEFTQAVLQRTRNRARARRLRHRISDWWVRQLERPQFAGEFAYALTVLMLLAVFVPASPFSSLPRGVIAVLQTEEADDSAPAWVEGGIVPVVTAPAKLLGAGERWSSSAVDELDARSDAVGIVFDLGGAHVKALANAVWERDWDALRPLFTEMRCDLRLLWDATRGALSSDDDEAAFRC